MGNKDGCNVDEQMEENSNKIMSELDNILNGENIKKPVNNSKIGMVENIELSDSQIKDVWNTINNKFKKNSRSSR